MVEVLARLGNLGNLKQPDWVASDFEQDLSCWEQPQVTVTYCLYTYSNKDRLSINEAVRKTSMQIKLR